MAQYQTLAADAQRWREADGEAFEFDLAIEPLFEQFDRRWPQPLFDQPIRIEIERGPNPRTRRPARASPGRSIADVPIW